MLDLKELQEELALSLLDEVWAKKHAALAAKDPISDWSYHNSQHWKHKERADFHKAAFHMHGPDHRKVNAKHNLINSVDDMKHHQRQAARHNALATAHAKLRDSQPTPSIDPKTDNYVQRPRGEG